MPKKRGRKNQNFILFKMKKLIFGFIAMASFTTASFANTSTLKNEIVLNKEIQKVTVTKESKEDEKVCTVSCSRVIGGVTYTATAGNFLSTCEGASARCEKKLDQLNTLQ